MAGFGRFKLTDALPEQFGEIDSTPFPGTTPAGTSAGKAKTSRKGKNKRTSASGKPSVDGGLVGEQLREARENNQAKNAEGSVRERMVDIGRGNQQAGRQRAK